jgi:anti-sigma regulatory factor (Ser/Thr protein kinase)
MSAPVTRTFRAHPSALFEIRQFVRTLAEGETFPAQMTGDLLVAVSEACANSILHTNTPEVRVTWKRFGACVEVEVLDEGVFRRRVRMPEVEGGGGHGISLMMALVDELSIREGTAATPGTRVRLVKCKTE